MTATAAFLLVVGAVVVGACCAFMLRYPAGRRLAGGIADWVVR